MRRTLPFVALWFAAGALAVAVASAGVAVVSDQLAGGTRPGPLSAEQVRDELASVSTTTVADAAPPSATTAPGSVGPSTTDTSVGATTPSIAPSTTPVTGPAPTAAPPPPAPPITRSYDLVGGTTTLRFTPQGVEVLVASPAPGFTVELGETHSNGVRVEFESDDHRSRVDAWWDGGPRDEVDEDFSRD